MDRFLSPHAWVQQVHPDTLGLVDLSCFRCLAWSTDPTTLPPSKELWVVEPPTAVVEDPPVKRVLAYPVSIRYSIVPFPGGLDPPADPGDDDDSGDNGFAGRRRRRVHSPSPPPRLGSVGGPDGGNGGGSFGMTPYGGTPGGATSHAAGLRPLSNEPVLERVPPGDGHPGVVAVTPGPEDVPAPDAVAAHIAVVSDVDVVELGQGEPQVGPLPFPPGLGCNSQLVASGCDEATVCCFPGQPVGPCSLSHPIGLATDGVTIPASPRSPLHSVPGSPLPAPDTSLSPSSSALVPLQVAAESEPSCPAPPAARSPHAGELGPDPVLQGAASTPPLRVYARRRRRDRSPAPAVLDGSSSGPGAGSRLRVLDEVRKPVDCLLPLPVIQKRRRKAPPPGSLPRRSRRVAGAAPCSPGPALSKAQKKVMRQLGFEERELILPEAQDNYSKLYGPMLSVSQVSAMAAIFGWTAGDGEQVRPADVVTLMFESDESSQFCQRSYSIQ